MNALWLDVASHMSVVTNQSALVNLSMIMLLWNNQCTLIGCYKSHVCCNKSECIISSLHNWDTLKYTSPSLFFLYFLSFQQLTVLLSYTFKFKYCTILVIEKKYVNKQKEVRFGPYFHRKTESWPLIPGSFRLQRFCCDQQPAQYIAVKNRKFSY